MVLSSFNRYQGFVVYRFKKDLEDTMDITITVCSDGRSEVKNHGFYSIADYQDCFNQIAKFNEVNL